jgi:hypothetical protein
MFDLSLQKTGRNLKSTVRPNGAAAQASEPHPGRKKPTLFRPIVAL